MTVDININTVMDDANMKIGVGDAINSERNMQVY